MDKFKTVIVNNRFVIVLFLGIVAGSIFANVFGTTHINDWGIFDGEYLEKYTSISVNNGDLWKYVVKDRLRDYLFLCIISLTSISISMLMLYLFYIGMGAGLIISMASMQYGIYGIWLYIVSVFPHYIFYTIAMIVLINWKFTPNDFRRIRGTRQGMLALVCTCVLVIVGTYLEAYINPTLIKDVIYNIF